MKRILIVCSILVLGLTSQAQELTTLSGKLTNKMDKQIALTVMCFDTIRLMGYEDSGYKNTAKINAEVLSDSTYVISTDQILYDFTPCRLFIGSDHINLLLSPGDSLQFDLDYWSFKTSPRLDGKGAIRNMYLREKQRIFYDSGRSKAIRYYNGQARIDQQKSFEQDQLGLLNKYWQEGLLDSAFYNWEQRQIKYETFAELSYKYNKKPTDSTELAALVHLFKSFYPSDSEAFLTMPSYRRILRSMIQFMDVPAGSEPSFSLRLRLEIGQKKYSGLIRSYVVWTILDQALRGASSQVEKDLIWDYAWNNVKDERIKQLLTKPIPRWESRSQNASVIVEGVVWTLVIVAGILLLIYFLIRLSRRFKQQNRRLNTMAWLKYGLIGLMGFILIGFIFPVDEHSTWNLLLIVAGISVWLIHTFWMIPRFFLKKRVFLYVLNLLLLAAVYFLALYFLVIVHIDHPGPEAIFKESFSGWSISIVPILLFSFLYHYVAQLAKLNQPIIYLFKEKIVSPEVIGNVIVASFIYLTLMGDNMGHFRLFTIFWLVMGIFYAHALWVFPKFLLRGRYIKTVLLSLLLFLGTAAFLTIYQALEVYNNIIPSGIPVQFSDALEFPENLELFFFIIPALLYALAKYWIVHQQEKGFFLYRKSEAEFQQLKSQVNPHFLFNTLNTVYASALQEGNTKTAESIAKLASLMRYLIEDMEQEKIPIRKEINYIEDYLKLQLNRTAVEHDIQVKVDLNEPQKDLEIAPMMMIPFVENAFKHGLNPNKTSEIKINFTVLNNDFQFVIENSVDDGFEAFYKEKGFGIGIENIRKRLEHMYPGVHNLSIANTGERFIVILSIQLSEMA